MIISLPSKGTIYHYSSFTVLESILRDTRALWLSHSSCLNDITEGIHGVNQVCKILKESQKNAEYLSLIQSLQSSMEYAIKEAGFYVVSFCENGNLLSQWRAYGDDGCGVAIGFDAEYFKALCVKNANDSSFYILGKCGYTSGQYVEIFQNVYKHFCPSPEIKIPEDAVVQMLAVIASFCKHDTFAEEQECRIVVGPDVDKKYRKSGERVVPYHELSLSVDYSWLKEIIVGPCHQQIATKTAIGALLDELSIKNVAVQCSPTPYRGRG